MKKNNNYNKFSNVLRKVTEDKTIKPQLEFAKVNQAWKTVLGDKLSKYVSSSFYKDETLHIRVTSAPLKHELMMSRKLIIEKINELCGEELVKYIKIS